MVNQIHIIDGTNGVVFSTDMIHDHCITGTVSLSGNWAIVYNGTPTFTEVRTFRYLGKITLNAHQIVIFGTKVHDAYASKEWTAIAYYNGTTWDVEVRVDFDETDIIETDHIVALAVTTSKINALAVTTPKIALLAVDSTILAADSVITTKITDANITYAKLQNFSANTILCNPTAGALAPQELALSVNTFPARLAGNIVAATVAQMQTALAIRTSALADAKIWVGNGAGLAVAVTPSGDISMDNTGLMTIADSVVSPVKLRQVASGSVNTGVVAVKYIEGAALLVLLDSTVRQLFSMKSKDVVLSVLFVVQTAAAASTVDVGVDGVFRGAGLDANGLIESANSGVAGKYSSDNATYSGVLLDYGQFTGSADGYITIQSNIDIHSSATFVGFCMVTYLPA